MRVILLLLGLSVGGILSASINITLTQNSRKLLRDVRKKPGGNKKGKGRFQGLEEINADRQDKKFFQGDMVLTDEQWANLFTRNFLTNTNWYWTDVKYSIPWIDETTGTKATPVILEAIAYYEEHTCLRFEQLSSTWGRSDYLKFIVDGGCYSYVGRVNLDFRTGQDISIGSGCEYLGIVIHEIMHAMGAYHEQSRQDRDQYIQILYENMGSDKVINFESRPSLYYDTPYDVYSVMHYGTRGFSSNGHPTIRAIHDPKLETFMGQRDGMSFYDLKQINTAYDCIADWEAACPSVTCLNEGYVGPNCACVCRDGTNGANCETVTATYLDAIDLASDAVTNEVITSSGPISVSYAGYDEKYTYTIVNEPCTETVLQFTSFDLYGPHTDGLCHHFDYLEIRKLESDVTVGNLYCGTTIPDPVRTTETLVLYGQRRSWNPQWNALVTYDPLTTPECTETSSSTTTPTTPTTSTTTTTTPTTPTTTTTTPTTTTTTPTTTTTSSTIVVTDMACLVTDMGDGVYHVTNEEFPTRTYDFSGCTLTMFSDLAYYKVNVDTLDSGVYLDYRSAYESTATVYDGSEEIFIPASKGYMTISQETSDAVAFKLIIETLSNDCHQDIVLTLGESGVIEKMNYPPSTFCEYHLSTTDRSRILLDFEEFVDSEGDCEAGDYMFVSRIGDIDYRRGTRYCDGVLRRLRSRRYDMRVVLAGFDGNDSFRATYRAIWWWW